MSRTRRCAGGLLIVSVWMGFGSTARGLEPHTEEAQARGLTYTMMAYPQAFGNLGFGCGFADLDNDGDDDVIILGAADGKVGIFENDGTGHFTDRSSGSGIPLMPQGTAFASADVDGDGDLDLYFSLWTQPNVLVRNNGNFQFSDITADAGVGDPGEGEAPNFGDFDGDGWLDLYLCNYTGIVLPPPAPNNKLYRNLGDGTFEDVSVAQTVDDPGYGFQAVWTDYDRDGDVDLYLSNDRGFLPPLFRTNQLWRNDGGQLVNVSVGSGADLGLFSMGVAAGDFDGNGWPDLYVTNIAEYADGFNPLFLNQGDGTFVESSAVAGVDLWVTSWGSIFYDFDNDGWLDLYVNTQFEANALFVQDSGFPCAEMAAAANVAAAIGDCSFPPGAACKASFGSAVADVDNDGDLDLLVNNLGTNVELFINHEGETRNWIRYRVIGQAPNHFAVGANVDTRFGPLWQFREVLAGGNGYLGQNELTVHVGAGTNLVADEVVVSWPGGKTTRTITNLPANRAWALYPPERLGDADGDGDVQLDDFWVLAGCYQIALQPGCEVMDFNGDSQVDADDAAAFLAVYDGAVHDCNGNAQEDLLEILDDPAQDQDNTGIPDACEQSGDLNGDGVVNASDLAGLLGNWGPCDCPADVNNDGTVNAADLAILLGNWG